MVKLVRRLLRNKRGAALVEYALIVAGVALIAAAAVSVFGHKTSDMLATAAAVLPGAPTLIWAVTSYGPMRVPGVSVKGGSQAGF